MSQLQFGQRALPLGGVTHVMGVVNVSPDSKNTHTIARSVDEAVVMADRYRRWGATIIDVGGQSSHIENETIAASEEAARVVPVIEALSRSGHIVAVDTWKPSVAREAIDAGASIINDTGGMSDPAMRDLVAATGVAAVAVYVEGAHPHDVGEVEIRDDKAKHTATFFEGLLAELGDRGIHNVILDPGIALNYRGDYEAYSRMQLQVMAGSGHLKSLGRPVLIPIPRKRDGHRLAVYTGLAVEHEADIIRAHDVAMACDIVRLFGRMP